MTTAASAMAYVVPLDVPIGWSQPDDVNMVHALVLLVGCSHPGIETILEASRAWGDRRS